MASRIARLAHWLAVVLLLAMAVLPGRGQDGALPEAEVKAAFLYNFAKFIQWPPRCFDGPKAKLVIGIIGTDSLGKYLDQLEGKAINGHEIEVKRLAPNAFEEAKHCHVLFIGEDHRAAQGLVQRLDKAESDVLTVTDEVDGFPSVGAVINLVKSPDNRVRFEINVDAARRAELKINSSLLNLARIVRDGKA
jgi:hypothetical protein